MSLKHQKADLDNNNEVSGLDSNSCNNIFHLHRTLLCIKGFHIYNRIWPSQQTQVFT